VKARDMRKLCFAPISSSGGGLKPQNF